MTRRPCRGRTAWWAIALAVGPGSLAPATLGGQERSDTIWAAPSGAAGIGTRARPFTSLEEARDAARVARRAGREVTVILRGGEYPRSRSFLLGPEDGGTAQAPATWTALPGEHPRIRGARRVLLEPIVRRTPTFEALSRAARVGVRRIAVGEATGAVGGLGDGARPKVPELFSDDAPLTLSRWPSAGWRTIASVDSSEGAVTLGLNMPFTQNGAGRGAELEGYFRWDWAAGRIPLDSIAEGRIRVGRGRSPYGWGRDQRVAVVNHPAGLTAPGRYLYDPEANEILVWPGRQMPKWVAVLDSPVVVIRDAAHLRLEGLTIGWTGGAAILVSGSDSVALDRMAVRFTGGNGIEIRGGQGVRVTRTEIVGAGYAGLVMEGGDRATLTPSGQVAEDDRILRSARWNPTRRSVHLIGVGQRVSHTEIAHTPFEAILPQGNDFVIDSNHIHHLLQGSRDAGAIHMGRDWTERGTVIRDNLFHDIGDPTLLQSSWEVTGIYLDDAESGTTIEGNVFLRVPAGIHLGGGRDNLVTRNAFLCADPAVFVSFRGAWTEPKFKMRDLFAAMHPDQPPYSVRYPALAHLLDGDPWVPAGNTLDSNVVTGVALATQQDRPAPVEVRGTMTMPPSCRGTAIDTPITTAIRRSGLPLPRLRDVGPRTPTGN